MSCEAKLIMLDETLRDTNRLLCIVADTLLDILATIDDGNDDILASRMFAVMDHRMRLGVDEVAYEN